RDPEEPDCGAESQQTGFSGELQVVIMRLINQQTGVEAAELRIDLLECDEPPAQYRASGEHDSSIAINTETNIAPEFGATIAIESGDPGGNLVTSNPSN